MAKRKRKLEIDEKGDVIIRENMDFFALGFGALATFAAVLWGYAIISDLFQKGVRHLSGGFWGFLLAWLFVVLLAFLFVTSAIVPLIEKHHLVLSRTHLKYRKGNKKLLGRVSYSDIHSTKIDKWQPTPQSYSVKALFIYLRDGFDPSTKWDGFRPQDNLIILRNVYSNLLETIQDLLDERVEQARW